MAAHDIVMAAAGGSGAAPVYIEDVFNTWVTTTPGGSFNVLNGLDFTKDGGLVWAKNRTLANASHCLYTKTSGAGNFVSELQSDNTNAASTGFTFLTALSNGFTDNVQTTAGRSLVYWSFRKQPKFFDVVSWTGLGPVAHQLGAVPGFVIFKATNNPDDWYVLARKSDGTYEALRLDATSPTAVTMASASAAGITATSFNPGAVWGASSANSYVGIFFAHNAGGFGLTGTDNVISCGSFTVSGTATATVTLGFEPQLVLLKNVTTDERWWLVDVMRGQSQTTLNDLRPNAATPEGSYGVGSNIIPTATGFTTAGLLNGFDTYVYIAIRRGPMKVPTDGTSVFSPILSSAGGGTDLTTNFPVDLQIASRTAGTTSTTKSLFFDRLRGASTTATGAGQRLQSNSGASETTLTNGTLNWSNTGFQMPGLLGSASTVFWNLRRAPGFFDEVCYACTGTVQSIAHNLTVVPELIIAKTRTGTVFGGAVYAAPAGNGYLRLFDALATTQSAYIAAAGPWNNTAPTSSVFTVGTSTLTNNSGNQNVAYLFASCPGVSKIGSYTGTGAAQTINCGFTAGARFVLIKRTDSTGDWYLWDTARGIISGNDPYLLLNSTDAEVTTTDYISPQSVGFGLTASAPASLNASGGTYIYLAIA